MIICECFPGTKGERNILFFSRLSAKGARNADKASAGRARVLYIADFDINDNKLASQTFPGNTRGGGFSSVTTSVTLGSKRCDVARRNGPLLRLRNSMHVIPSSFSEWRLCTRDAPSSTQELAHVAALGENLQSR